MILDKITMRKLPTPCVHRLMAEINDVILFGAYRKSVIHHFNNIICIILLINEYIRVQ